MMLRRYVLIFMLFLSCGIATGQTEYIYQGTVIPKAGTPNGRLLNEGPFPVGFDFVFFGNTYSQFYVSANGLVMFVTPTAGFGTEASIPSAADPDNYIAPFWDDLVIDGTGNILYTTVGASPNRKLIVQFRNMGFYPFPPFFGTFDVIIYETSNIIQVQYRLIVDYSSTKAHGESATIGIENSDGSAGAQYAYHNPAAITTKQAISFTPGAPYTINSNASYDPVFLVTNLTLPEPGITKLVSPPQDAIVGSDVTFEWDSASNAANYSLKISNYSDLTDAVSYDAGSNLTYDVTGLILDTTYYWGVFASNATGLSWCEIKKFTTSSAPPLVAVPQTVWAEQNQDKTIKLNYTGGDASDKTAIITSLPLSGQLYQYNAGSRGAEITGVLTTVTDASRNVIYAAIGSTGNGVGNFSFKVHDDSGDSPDTLVTVNVSPPGMPNLLYTGKATTYFEMQFDRSMSNPIDKQNQFTVTVNGSPASLNALSLKSGDPNTIIAIFTSPILLTDAVTVSYIAGDITSEQGGILASFNAQTITLLAQTITFTTNLTKKYNESPFTLSATASSSLPMTYSSSNLSVATISGNIVTLLYTGTSDITARQAGDATWAPAKFIRTLTVAKGDQLITFNALPTKTYGDIDFTISATASSGLSVSFASDNTAVATVTGDTVHIVGGGTAVITASQSGNTTLWNPAPDVPQTLTVNKADQTITFDVLPEKTYGDADFTLEATSSSGLNVIFTSGNTGVATIAGTTLHITGGGTSVITASQPGNTNYNPASDIQQTLTVNKADQTITFSAIPAKAYGDADFALTATASSGLSIVYSSDNLSVATVTGDMVHITGMGTSLITASQPGNTNYNPASDVQQPLTVTIGTQVITFTAYPQRLLVQDSYSLAATSSADLPVLFESADENIATVSGSQVTGVEKGTVQLRAYNDGDDNYTPAEAFVTIEVYSTHADILNLFTPNNDGINDLWELPDLQEWGTCDVKVYNRWGKLVFADKNYNNTWNGTSEGSPLPEGAYYFVIKTENAGTVKGTINLVR